MFSRKSSSPLIILAVLLLTAIACSAVFPRARTTAVPSALPLTLTPTNPQPTPSPLPSAIAALLSAPTPTPLALPTSVSAKPASEKPRPTEESQTLFDQYLPNRQQVGETEHFVFYAQDEYFPVDLDQWMRQSEEAYDYVSQRVRAESDDKIHLAFLPSQKEACPVRGLASSIDQTEMVIIFADPSDSQDYVLGVLAHELGHSIPADDFEGGLPNDLSLTEGLATWASGKYGDAWKNVSSVHEVVRQNIAAGNFDHLHEIVELPGIYPWQPGAGKDCLERRDQQYFEWASFLDFLIDRYGWEKVHQLFESKHSETQGSRVVHYPTDYQQVLGKALNQLEIDWLNYVLNYP